MKINQVKIKKKQSIISLYKQAFIEKMILILFVCVVIGFIYILFKYILYYLDDILTLLYEHSSIIVFALMIASIMIYIIVTLCYFTCFIVLSVIEIYKLRYLPISHEECIELNLNDVDKYLQVVNDIMIPMKGKSSYKYVIPDSLIENIESFCKKEFDVNVCLEKKGEQWVWVERSIFI